MSFFKTKEEKRIMNEMAREEQLNAFNERLDSLKSKREEYANLCAETEASGDEATFEIMEENLYNLNEMISQLLRTKANFDLISITNSIAIDMAAAVNILDRMANSKNEVPNLRKVQKVSAKFSKYMREMQVSTRAMGNMLKTNNPAGKTKLTPEQKQSIRPMIDAARAKMGGTVLPASSGVASTSEIDSLMSQIEEEKNKII